MNNEEILETLNKGTEREISDLSFILLDITDMTTLKQCSLSVKEIMTIFERIDKNNKDKVASLTRILSFLTPISKGGCRCEKYNICSYISGAEQKKGLVNTLSVILDKKNFAAHIVCECVLCKRVFNVHEYEAGFGQRFDWSIKTK